MSLATLPPPLPSLLAGAIDYAGLFPPAALGMAEAVANYAAYRESEDRAALGRFIVPAGRLEECLDEVARLGGTGWRFSITLGADPVGELVRLVETASGAQAQGHAVDSFEARVASPAEVERLARAVAGRGQWYGEVAPGEPFVAILDAIGQQGGRAKLRMGGVTPEAFPEAGVVARFLVALAVRRLPFKATAGLHHPVRGTYRLTYRPDAPVGLMYGFLNLLVAIGLAQAGAPVGDVEQALLETNPARLVTADGPGWAGHRFDADALAGIRRQFDGFGSCSFREPMDELPPAISR
ncbi:MAG: hypothetical protein SFV24_03550 [Gemmatimonadales bacterium]|nr:hypothetical protein [Gemmatimonadales bacterium]